MVSKKVKKKIDWEWGGNSAPSERQKIPCKAIDQMLQYDASDQGLHDLLADTCTGI